MPSGNYKRNKREDSTLCWDCANAYADKCIKFQTEKRPLPFWRKYKRVKMKSESYKYAYQVIECDNFVRETDEMRVERMFQRKRRKKYLGE